MSNTLLRLADQFAANGYLTVIPDLFSGDTVPLPPRPAGFELQDWLSGKYNKNGTPHDAAHTEPFVQGAIKYLKEKHGAKRVGAIGYCFGAKYVVRGLGETGGIDVGCVAHPSFVEETELAKIGGPLNIAAARETATPRTPSKRPAG